MDIKSRRRFFSMLTVLGSLTVLPQLHANDSQNGNTETDMVYAGGPRFWETLQFEELEPLTGQSFTVYGNSVNCTVTLKSVKAGPDDPNRPASLKRKRSFNAIFVPMWSEGCPDSDQLVYFAHPEIGGEGVLFAMAKTSAKHHPFLEVAFN